MKHLESKIKEPLFNGSLDYTGSETFRADVEFASFTTAYIYADCLNVNKPAAPCVSV